jgi:hypothetical protein
MGGSGGEQRVVSVMTADPKTHAKKESHAESGRRHCRCAPSHAHVACQWSITLVLVDEDEPRTESMLAASRPYAQWWLCNEAAQNSIEEGKQASKPAATKSKSRSMSRSNYNSFLLTSPCVGGALAIPFQLPDVIRWSPFCHLVFGANEREPCLFALI